MLSLIPLPYRILIAAAAAAIIFGFGYLQGEAHAQAKTDAAQVAADKAHAANVTKYVALNNALSSRLAVAEGTIVTKTVEVIKYVPKYTTGRLCLGSDAVRLLQPGDTTRISPTPSKPNAEDANASASDTDIAYWVADANKDYETCAVRLNTLIDYVSLALSDKTKNFGQRIK
jgi:hypothetical protein